MGNLFGESINGPTLKEKLNNSIIIKNKDEQTILYNINVKNSLTMNYIEIIRNGQSLSFGITNSLIIVPHCLLGFSGSIDLNNKKIINYNGSIKNINKLKIQDSSIVSDGIEYRKENESTKYYLVEGNIRVGYQTNNFKGNFKNIGYGNIEDKNIQDSNRLVLDAYDNYFDTSTKLSLIDFYIQAPYDIDGNEQGIENSLSFWWNDERNQTYTIYGDHNNVFHAGEINIRQPNQGRGIIGSHEGSKKDNAIYLRSLNLNTENGAENYSTFEIRSPKNTDGTAVDLKDRLKFQTAGDFNYRIYGEHNYKEAVICIPKGTGTQTYTFQQLGVNFVPQRIIANMGYLYNKEKINDKDTYVRYLFFGYDSQNFAPIQEINFDENTNQWKIQFNNLTKGNFYIYIQFYG